MENIEISIVTLNDIIQLQYISRSTFIETFAAINSAENMDKYLTDSFSAIQLKLELNNEQSHFYFAKYNGEVIGYLKLNSGQAQKENPNENALEIERIYVSQEFQGKKVGQLLYSKAIEIAKDMGVEHVWLGVWERNFKALAFYKKNGFVQFGEHEFVLGDDRQTDLLMKKILEN